MQSESEHSAQHFKFVEDGVPGARSVPVRVKQQRTRFLLDRLTGSAGATEKTPGYERLEPGTPIRESLDKRLPRRFYRGPLRFALWAISSSAANAAALAVKMPLSRTCPRHFRFMGTSDQIKGFTPGRSSRRVLSIGMVQAFPLRMRISKK